MGMMNYLAKFIPRLSDITPPLRKLPKKDTEWHWNEHQETAFNKVKHNLVEDTLLRVCSIDPIPG